MLSQTDIQSLRQLTDVGNPHLVNHSNDVISSQSYEVEHLDYDYVRQSTDVSYLHVLLTVLRSGKEGLYPDLEAFIEGRIQQLGGQVVPSASSVTVSTQERNSAEQDIKEWLEKLNPATTSAIKNDDSNHKLDQTSSSPTDSDLLLDAAIQSNVKGHEALRSGDYTEAIEYYRSAVSFIPTDPRFPANCSIAYSKLGDHEHAANCAQDALKLFPNPQLSYKCYLRLAIARYNQKRWKDALDALDQCSRLSSLVDNASDHQGWIDKTKSKWRDTDFTSYRTWAERDIRGKPGKKVKITVVEAEG